MLENDTAKNEVKILNNKIRLLENQRQKTSEELKDTKVILNTKDDEIAALKTQKDEAYQKHQVAITELN